MNNDIPVYVVLSINQLKDMIKAIKKNPIGSVGSVKDGTACGVFYSDIMPGHESNGRQQVSSWFEIKK